MSNLARASVYMKRAAEQHAVARAMSARAHNPALCSSIRSIADEACRQAVERAFRLEEIAFDLAFDGTPLAVMARGR